MENTIPKLIHYWVLNDELLNEVNILNIHNLNKNYRILIHTTNKSRYSCVTVPLINF